MRDFNYFNIMNEVEENVVRIKVSGRYAYNENATKTYFLTLSNSEIENFLENGIKSLKGSFYDSGYYVDEIKLINSLNTYDLSDIL